MFKNCSSSKVKRSGHTFLTYSRNTLRKGATSKVDIGNTFLTYSLGLGPREAKKSETPKIKNMLGMCSRYRLCMLPENRFDLRDVTTTKRAPIATPTVVAGDLFFGQRSKQFNGGRGTVADCQPVRSTLSFCTIVVHRRLGTDQCDGGTMDCNHSTRSTLAHFHVGTSSDTTVSLRNHTSHHTVPQGHRPS